MEPINNLRKIRLEKLAKIEKLGINPYPAVVKRDQTIKEARSMDGKIVAVAGRAMSIRGHGKLIFVNLNDESGKIQIVFKADLIKTKDFSLLELIDIGDFLAVQGEVGKTKTAEISVFANEFQIITKSLLPLPDQWYGLKDVEERYRKRYLDTILNPEVKERLKVRSLIIKAIRDFLDEKGFIEVETPTLQAVYGGGFARPFMTHHNELDADFYLRISDEMFLKRLIVGGFDKVFEITKVFRNEGIDREHNPEFTMFEAQIAYKDYFYGMDISEEIIEVAAKKALGTTKVFYQNQEIDFKRPWKRYKMVEAIKEFTGVDALKWTSISEAQKDIISVVTNKEKLGELKKLHTLGELTAFLFEEAVEEKLLQPTIIYDFPVEVSPLAKKCEDERFTQRFEMFVLGVELGNNYTELNDALDLSKRFVEEKRKEEAGFEEAMQVDYDYLAAIEHGFPPTCGLGIGIDRLVMFLSNAPSLKEIIAFPTLRPEQYLFTKSGQTQPDISSIIPVGNLPKEIGYIAPELLKNYSGFTSAGAIIEGVTIKKGLDELQKLKEEISKEISPKAKNLLSHSPCLEAYVSCYKKMHVDVKSRMPSPTALLTRIAEGKELYSVNTCVDAYNIAVLLNQVSVGAFDLDKMTLPIYVKEAEGGETIKLLGKEEETKVKKGEICYFDQQGPYNLDINYRDAQRTAVTEKTKNIMLNVDGAPGISSSEVARTLNMTIQLIQRFCEGAVKHAGWFISK